MVEVKVNIDTEGIEKEFLNLINDKNTMLQVHNEFARYCEPYVPFSSDLANLEITPNYVRYNTPYAHYDYVGEVYGPNIPIIEDGVIVGWFSIPNKPKYATGRPLHYNKPLASAEWDKAMMKDKGNEFAEQVRQILINKINS